VKESAEESSSIISAILRAERQKRARQTGLSDFVKRLRDSL